MTIEAVGTMLWRFLCEARLSDGAREAPNCGKGWTDLRCGADYGFN
jgi:hypothetical protein